MLKVILVKWIDAFYDGVWFTTKEVSEQIDFIIEDVGFLIEEGDKYLRFGTSWNEETKRWKHIHNILKVNIISKRILK